MPKRHPKVEQYAQEMRKRPTPAEKRFRVVLANCCSIFNCNYEFQKTFWNGTIGKWYIADFYVHDCRLVIEVDGASHSEPEQIISDKTRDDWFKSSGKRVLRVLNRETFDAGYCKDVLVECFMVKRLPRQPKKKKTQGNKAVIHKTDKGVTICKPYTEKDFRRNSYNAWRRSPKGPKPRKLTMKRT